MLGDLLLCASSFDRASFDERLAAASEAGFHGIGLRPSHYKAARAHGYSDSDLRSKLSDHDLELVEIGFLADWWLDNDRSPSRCSYEGELYKLKERLGG